MVHPDRPETTTEYGGMSSACLITKATDIYSAYVMLFVHGDNGYANGPPSYLTRTLLVLLLPYTLVAEVKFTL
jgi:hypothetical protein